MVCTTMMTQSELSIIIKAIDEASANINKVKSELDGLKNEAGAAGGAAASAGKGMAVLGDGAGKADKKVKNAGKGLKNFTRNCSTANMAMSGLFGSISLSTITDMTVGLALQRQQMEALTGSLMHSKSAAKQLYQEMDRITTKSVINTEELAESMNTIYMSVGLNNEEMMRAAEVVDHVGQVAYLQGFRGMQLTEKMKATLNGLSGDWRILKYNFGKELQGGEALKKLGWSGSENDVMGYLDAFDLYLQKHADVSGAMDNTAGRIAIVQKEIRIAGRKIGEEILPILDKLLSFFLALPQGAQTAIIQLIIFIGAIASFLMILAPVLYSLGRLGTLLLALTGAETITAAITAILGGAFTFLTGPVGVVLLLIIAIALAFYLAYTRCKPFKDFVDKTAKSITDFAKRLWEGKISAEELGETIGWLLTVWVTLPYQLLKFATSVAPKVRESFKRIGTEIRDELAKIPGRIRDALPAAISAAIGFGRGLVRGVLKGLGRHSPGIIQNETIDEITETIGMIDKLKLKASNVGASFGRSLANSTVTGSADFSGNLTRSTISNHRGSMDIRLKHDLENVPAGTDEYVLAEMINRSEDNVLVRAIAKNGVFQAIDKRIKENDTFGQKRSVGL